MKVKNVSGNTLYVEDLDIRIPYEEDRIDDIHPDFLKQSQSLRSLIINKILQIIEYNPDEQIETSIVYLMNKNKFSSIQNTKEPDIDIDSGKIDVRIHGLFYDAGGYAKVNRNLATKLSEAGFNVQITPKRSPNQLNSDELASIVKLEKTTISQKNHILIDSIIPSFAEMSTGKYRILYTTIESYTVPEQFIKCCELYHEIWLNSEWSASILRKYIKDKPVFAIRGSVDTQLYKPSGPRLDFRPNIKDFVFISVFGWSYRKGYDVLLRAYFDEFDNSDNVSLLLVSRYQYGTTKFHRNRIKDDIDNIMQEFPNKSLPHVVRYSQIIPEKQMPQLYRSANCFILLSRGEGLALPPLEASLCGLPVIMTNCSGQQDYLREDNSYLVNIDRIEKIKQGQMHLHYWDGQEFPLLTSPEVHKQVKQIMRKVVNNASENKIKNQNMQKMVLDNFTSDQVAISAGNRLKEIYKRFEE